MELTNITFSNTLVKNKTVYISYFGDLYQNNSDSLYIVYGFGDNWAHTTEQQMKKSQNGFTAKIKILDFNNFNFCFRNQNNVWDNNNNANYIVPIEEKSTLYDNFIINGNEIEKIIDGLFKKDVSTLSNKKFTLSNNTENTAQKFDNSDNGVENRSIDFCRLDNGNENITTDLGGLDNKAENIVSDLGDLDNGTENVTTDFSNLDNGAQNFVPDFGDLDNGTENVTTDFSNLDNGAENFVPDFGDLDNGAENIVPDFGNLDNDTKDINDSDNNDIESIIQEINNFDDNNKNNIQNSNNGDNDSKTIENIIEDLNNFDNGTENIATDFGGSDNSAENFIPDLDDTNTKDITANFDNSNNTSENISTDFSGSDNDSKNNENTNSEFDMDNLINEILSPIASVSDFREDNLEDLKKEIIADGENFSFPIMDFNDLKTDNSELIAEDRKVNEAINDYITDLYGNIIIQEAEKISNKQINENELVDSFDDEQEVDNEIPLIEALNTDASETESVEPSITYAKESEETALTVSPRSLSKLYMAKKRIKLAFYKFFTSVPRFISGKLNESK